MSDSTKPENVTGAGTAGALPDDIPEPAARGKSVGEVPATLSNLALANMINNINLAQQNAVAHQQAMNQLTLAIVGKVVHLLTTLGPVEASSAQQILTGNAIAGEIAGMKAAVGAEPSKQ